MAEPADSFDGIPVAEAHSNPTDHTAGLGEKNISSSRSSPPPTSTKRNAFSELMSPKSSKLSKNGTESKTEMKAGFNKRMSSLAPSDPRAGLLQYITYPETFSSSTVLRVTEHTVLIKDLFPKATVHLLLLPRSPQHYNLHPHVAFTDNTFLTLIRSEAKTALELATSELSRLIGPTSRSNAALNAAVDPDNPNPPTTLPPGRDFGKEIRVGVHAHPSMAHLHVHLISKDMHSPCMKHRKHYNSFNTDFFIPLEDYPLDFGHSHSHSHSHSHAQKGGASDSSITSDESENPKPVVAGAAAEAEDKADRRTITRYQNDNLSRDFLCWRCGRNFGNRFKELKKHLDIEFEAWKTE